MISGSASLTSRLPRRHPVVERGVGVDRVEDGQVLGAAHLGVVLAEGRGDVHDARAVVVGDVVGGHDPPPVLAHHRLEELERALVAPALRHLGAGPAVEHRRLGVQAACGRSPRTRSRPPSGLGTRTYRTSGRPPPPRWRSGVHGVVVHTSRSASGPVAQREAHVDRGVDHVLVALGHLVRAEGGPAPAAVGRDPVALVQQALVPQLARATRRTRCSRCPSSSRRRRCRSTRRCGGQRRPVLDVAQHRRRGSGR